MKICTPKPLVTVRLLEVVDGPDEGAHATNFNFNFNLSFNLMANFKLRCLIVALTQTPAIYI
jgi:hypothetical protein